MRFVSGFALIFALSVSASAQRHSAVARLNDATTDLKEMMDASDRGIPQDLLNRASCVIIVPGLKSGGFIGAVQYGRGFFSCRKPNGVGWSAPGAIKLEGGKVGFLAGMKETDLIMLVMNKSGMDHLLRNKFQLGAEAAVAGGPVGRDSSAMTDAVMRAQILSYSRSRGVFGGVDVGGSAVVSDDEAIQQLYGKAISNREIIDSNIATPTAAEPFIRELSMYSSRK